MTSSKIITYNKTLLFGLADDPYLNDGQIIKFNFKTKEIVKLFFYSFDPKHIQFKDGINYILNSQVNTNLATVIAFSYILLTDIDLTPINDCNMLSIPSFDETINITEAMVDKQDISNFNITLIVQDTGISIFNITKDDFPIYDVYVTDQLWPQSLEIVNNCYIYNGIICQIS
jgi:hypothetical protein